MGKKNPTPTDEEFVLPNLITKDHGYFVYYHNSNPVQVATAFARSKATFRRAQEDVTCERRNTDILTKSRASAIKTSSKTENPLSP